MFSGSKAVYLYSNKLTSKGQKVRIMNTILECYTFNQLATTAVSLACAVYVLFNVVIQ